MTLSASADSIPITPILSAITPEPIILSASVDSVPIIPILSASIPNNPIDDTDEKTLAEEIKEGTYSSEMTEEEGDDEFVEGKILTDQKYTVPKEADKFIDAGKGEVIDRSKLTEFDVIKAVAKQNNIEIRNPRSGCRHCYGRGFIGRDYTTKQPIPCNCIYPPKTPAQKTEESIKDQMHSKPTLSRKMLKKLKRLIKSEKRKVREQAVEEKQRLEEIDQPME